MKTLDEIFKEEGIVPGDFVYESVKRIAELEAKIKHLTKHLEPQAISALFEQVEEEVKQEQRIAELEAQIEKMKCCGNCKHYTTFNNACMEYGYFLDRCDKTKWEIKEK